MKLASHIRPFDAKQTIYVLTNNYDTEEIILSDLSNYAETVMQLTAQYPTVEELELRGPIAFCEKAQKDITKAEFAKYNCNKLKITIKED